MLSKDLNEVAAKLRTEYAARSAEVVNDVAKLYAERFTSRAQGRAAFYKSPLGKDGDRGAGHPRSEHAERAGWPTGCRKGHRQDARRDEKARHDI
jgi:hypothetical protein